MRQVEVRRGQAAQRAGPGRRDRRAVETKLAVGVLDLERAQRRAARLERLDECARLRAPRRLAVVEAAEEVLLGGAACEDVGAFGRAAERRAPAQLRDELPCRPLRAPAELAVPRAHADVDLLPRRGPRGGGGAPGAADAGSLAPQLHRLQLREDEA